jgi:two-component system response regulator DesR
MTSQLETNQAPISLFLVDDVPELRELIRYGIEEDESFEVVGEAGDGRSAIDGVAEKRPAAVLLDLSMPDMDGFAAIPEIRSRHSEVAIIVLSGFPAIRMSERARERGADGYVEKGGPIAELREAIREAVSARRAA